MTDVTTPFDRAERRIWSGKAEAYARTCARLCAHPAAALLDAAEAGPGSRVLDVGCGSRRRPRSGTSPAWPRPRS
ncbi:hypothetical protein [Streptomyces sp. ADI98-10]|uniref:hypothetical protein n=1 Tax=Streptomyces sp. ADI98-10 TaxID=1522763 RepID=UPI001F14BD55|nr:hypothetical protein [Streptomyces sp. ADI98-10]